MSKSMETILDALRRDGRRVTTQGETKARAQCPAHDGDGMNLAIWWMPGHDGNGETKVWCHSRGCESDDVLEAIGLDWRDRFDNRANITFRYDNADGILSRWVVRSYDPVKRKRKIERQDIKDESAPASLYQLASVQRAVEAGVTVYLVEGEPDVHRLEAEGLVATTGPGGSGTIGKVDLSPLTGATVVAIVDRDPSGEEWARVVKERLDGIAKEVTFKQSRLDEKGSDVSDHLAAGHTLEELEPYEVEEAVPARRARVTWASTIKPKPVSWLWKDNEQGRIPGGALVMAAGREGTGKSSFGLHLAAQITNGTLPGALEGTPRRVLYVAVEDSWEHTLVPRLIAAGADLSRVGRMDVVSEDDDELTLSLPVDNALLEATIVEHDVALVVVDPLMSAVNGKIDTHNERSTRSALDPLARIASRTGAVVLGIAHFNKGGGSDAASLITGSGAFKNVPRAIFGFAKDDEAEDRVMTQVKNSLGNDRLPSLSYRIAETPVEIAGVDYPIARFEFTGESDRSVADVLATARTAPEDADERDDARVWLRDYLASQGGSAPARDVFKAGQADGFSKDALKRAKGGVAKSGKTGMQGGWEWVLTEDSTEGSTEGSEGSRDSEARSLRTLRAPFEEEVDERPICPEEDCGRRMGKHEAEQGMCFQCRNIALYEAGAA